MADDEFSEKYHRQLIYAIMPFQLLLDQRMQILLLQQIHMFRCLFVIFFNPSCAFLIEVSLLVTL